MTDTLTPEAIDAALEYVAARWPNHPFHAAQRESWSDVLVYMRPGELKPALATLAGSYRPDPDKVLAAAQGLRPKALPPNHRDAPKRDDPDPVDVDAWLDERYGETPPTSGGDWLRECRRMVGRTKEAE